MYVYVRVCIDMVSETTRGEYKLEPFPLMSFKFNSNDSSINVPNSVPSIERHVAQVRMPHASHLKNILWFLYQLNFFLFSSFSIFFNVLSSGHNV